MQVSVNSHEYGRAEEKIDLLVRRHDVESRVTLRRKKQIKDIWIRDIYKLDEVCHIKWGVISYQFSKFFFIKPREIFLLACNSKGLLF